jgi:hypothetical protein
MRFNMKHNNQLHKFPGPRASWLSGLRLWNYCLLITDVRTYVRMYVICGEESQVYLNVNPTQQI